MQAQLEANKTANCGETEVEAKSEAKHKANLGAKTANKGRRHDDTTTPTSFGTIAAVSNLAPLAELFPVGSPPNPRCAYTLAR